MNDIPGVYTDPPLNYTIPEWPGLYLPWNAPLYLYYPTSVWRYTVYWALTLTAVTFGLPGSLAFVVFSRKGTRYATLAIWLPFFFVIGGCLAAFIYATVVGFALAAIYSAAYLRMSTWVPFLWASAHTLIVIISSYSTLAGIL